MLLHRKQYIHRVTLKIWSNFCESKLDDDQDDGYKQSLTMDSAA